MLKFPCLVLDHDDTVVQTEKAMGYPYFCEILDQFRPGQKITLEDYVLDCYNLGFAEMCRQRWSFTQEELDSEYDGWMDYVMTHTPEVYPGIKELILRQKEEGGLVCVVSHSSIQNITRDYLHHFHMEPDAIYGWDLPREQRKPSSYPLLDIMKRYQLQPSDVLAVDDSMLGWKMADAAAVPSAFAAWSKLEFPSLYQEMAALCDYTFQDVSQLNTFLFA